MQKGIGSACCELTGALWVRAQVWQWLRHGAVVDGKAPLTVGRFDQLLKEEMAKLRKCVDLTLLQSP